MSTPAEIHQIQDVVHCYNDDYILDISTDDEAKNIIKTNVNDGENDCDIEKDSAKEESDSDDDDHGLALLYQTINKNKNTALFLPVKTEEEKEEYKNQILVFDVKTTKLLSKRDTLEAIKTEDSAYILQLSLIVFDTKKNESIQEYNSYVKVANSVKISSETTSITKKTCNLYGDPIINVLIEFYYWYHQCHEIIAHNLNFAKEMILIETIRNYSKLVENGCIPEILFSDVYNCYNKKTLFCTMLSGKYHINIDQDDKCSELCRKLLGIQDATKDTLTCLHCYLELIKYRSSNACL